MEKHFTKTKIIATVGPACSTKEQLYELVRAGADVFRLNFSHGSHKEHLEIINRIKELNKEHGCNVATLMDLQGPKIRIGEMPPEGVELVAGNKFIFTTEKMMGTAQKAYTTYHALPKDAKIGDRILLDDGKIEVRVTSISPTEVETEVVYGGILKSKKGMNLPDTNVSIPSLTEKDTEDLYFGLQNDIDWVALSFVRNEIDVLLLKHLIRQQGKNTKVIAKIEKPEAIARIDEIIKATDAVMIARGDLGVEIPAGEIPMLQKEIIRKCRIAFKPVIVATQMLESMINSPRPTRAETNDIATAVFDGADVLMLSAETATGKYPKLSVETMVNTIAIVERQPEIYNKLEPLDPKSHSFYNSCVVAAACVMAETTHAKAIIGITSSGYTAHQLSSRRPKADIFIFTPNRSLLTTLNLLWGVRVFYYDKNLPTEHTFQDLQNFLLKNKLIEKGDVVIHLASMPLEKKLRTNTIKLSVVGE
ncbi:MAG: pyruvate kinase [Microscillaceae bacterium]|nr:pyruvate kinase [Microscillaceae bacterium]MDW8460764.1 pyruvate kinase [Cytophagales bacterium]